MWAASDSSALLAAVQHSQDRGIAIDSSWRHKNENAAPLTFIVTTNSAQHVRPSERRASNIPPLQAVANTGPASCLVAAMLSEDIQTETLTEYLRETKKKVEAYADNLAGAL